MAFEYFYGNESEQFTFYRIPKMVDDKKIVMSAAVELSYLSAKEQADVFKTIEQEDASLSTEQAKKIRALSAEGKFNPEVVDFIMKEQKPETLKVTLSGNKLKKYFPKSYTKQRVEDTIIKLLENWHRKRQQEMER